MSISEYIEKIKPYYTPTLFILVTVISFGLGRLSAIETEKTGIKILSPETPVSAPVTETQKDVSQSPSTVTNAQSQVGTVIQAVSTQAGGGVIGVKTSKKYYFPWCGVVKRVKPENQLFFTSAETARQAGYVAGGGCKGLK